MVQNQPKVNFKNWLLLLLCAAIVPTFSFGQSSVTIGATSGTSHFVYGPYYRSSQSSSFNFSRYAYLYTGTELAIPAGSVITKVEWLKESGTISGSNTFNVWMKNSSNSMLADNTTWNSLISGASQVFSSSSKSFVAAANNWEEINLSSSFVYNGGSLQIMTDFAFNGTASAANKFYVNAVSGKALGWATTTPISGTMGLTSASYGDNRPTIRITYSSGAACSGTPTAGTATSNASSAVCSGSSVDLNLSGNSVGSGMTYEWQSSTNNSTWTSISSPSAVSSITVNPTANTYYRAVVTCGSNSSNSASVLVNVTPAFAGGTYTINPSAPASSTNFQSFTAFANALGCAISGPVVVNVSSGTYNEQLKLGSINGTSASNTITINGNNAIISNVSISANDRAVVSLNGTDYVTINNLSVRAISSSSSNYGWGIHITNDADYITINNCNVTLDSTSVSTNYAGIVVSGSNLSATTVGSNCNNISLTGNTVVGGYYGIATNGSNITISNNTVRSFAVYGIYGGELSTATIAGNNINRSTRSSNINSFYGIWLYNNNSNVSVARNRIHNPSTLSSQASFTFYGIGLNNSASNTNTISNNLIYSIQGNGDQYLLYNNASSGKWYHNSLSSDFPATTGGSTFGIVSENGSSIDARNNNVMITRGGSSGTRACINLSSVSGSTNTNNNNYFGSNGVEIGRIGSTGYSSLSSWSSATNDNASVSANPFYVNASNGSLTPSNSVLNNAGVGVGVTFDFNNNVRNTPPDIGAFEFSVNTCSGTPSQPLLTGALTACPNVGVGLSIASFATGVGISYQWESSPAALNNFTPIFGATNTTYTAIQTSAIKYRVVTTCSNSGGNSTSNIVTVSMTSSSSCYCASYAVGSDGSDITNVTFGNMVNSSTCSTTGGSGSMPNLYSNYSNSVTVTPGSKVPFSITVGNCSYPSSAYAKAYVDLNRDGDFTDANEEAFVSNSFLTDNGTTVSGVISIPSNASVGSTRMRIVMVETNNANDISSCGTYNFGETEDYVVNIVANSGTQPAVSISAVSNNTITLSITRGTGISGTFLAMSEGSPLNHDAVNFTTYNAKANASTVAFDDNTLDAVSNGKAIVYLTGKSGLTTTQKINKLKSGFTYYIYAYSYTTEPSGPRYNNAVLVDTITVVVPPTAKAKITSVTPNGPNGMTINWTNGSGSSRIVVMSETAITSTAPTTNVIYNGNSSFGSGDLIDGSTYVVAKIDGFGQNQSDAVSVTNLKAGTKYQVAIYEYNGDGISISDVKYGGASSKIFGTTDVDFIGLDSKFAGVGMSENFDTMSTTLPLGWHASSSLSNDDGNSSAQGIKNYGSNSNRSLGSLGTGSFGLKLRNTSTGSKSITWSSILVRYRGEQWRNGDASNDTLKVQYSTNAYTFNGTNQYLLNTAATWTDATSSNDLNFASVVSSPSNSAIDGNANSSFRVASILTNVGAGEFIWIRWVRGNGSVINDGLSVDDVTIIPFSNTLFDNDVLNANSNSGVNIMGNVSFDGKIVIKNAMNIEKGKTLNMVTGANTLILNGILYGTGTISSNVDDDINIRGTNLNQKLYFTSGSNTLSSLVLSSGSSAEIGNALNVVDNVTLGAACTLASNGNLTLVSASSKSAYIDKIQNGSSVLGKVNVQIALGNNAGVRLVSHPFSSGITLDSVSGFAFDVSGNSSQNVWYYDAQNSALGSGNTVALSQTQMWSGFGLLSSTWSSNTGIRLFKSVGTQTLTVSGPINQGAVSFNSVSGPSGVSVIGNPYPSAVRINNLPTGSINSISYWNPSGAGTWVSRPANKIVGTIIPMGASFIAISPANTTLNWSFSEADKQKTSNIATFLRPDVDQSVEGLSLVVNKGKEYQDELSIYLDANATTANDNGPDAIKIMNPSVDFNTIGSDNIALAVDTRPYVDGGRIPLSLNKANPGKYTISVSDWTLNNSSSLYLMDVYANKRIQLSSNSVYSFTVDNNSKSQGNGRFYIQMGKVSNVEDVISIDLAPNPATESVTIRVNASHNGSADIKIVSLTGSVLLSNSIESVAHGQLTIPVNQLPTGVYFVEVNVNGTKMTKQLIKQ